MIPKIGRLVFVANHPCGALDGLLALSIVLRIRPEAKVVVNRELVPLRNLSKTFIAVDSPRQKSRSSAGVRAMIKHIEAGKALLVFPAGWVASRWRNGVAEDGHWNPVLGRMIIRCQAPAVPIFVDGRNSRLFYCVRRLSRILGSKLLMRELFNKSGAQIPIYLGDEISYNLLSQISDPDRIMEFLRAKTYQLRQRANGHDDLLHPGTEKKIDLA
jgi:putative hemolysin